MEDKLYKEYLENKEYDKCIDFVTNKIVKYIVKEIRRSSWTFYRYTDLFNLLEASEKYLNGKYNENIKSVYRILKSDNVDDIIRTSLLVEIYETMTR